MELGVTALSDISQAEKDKYGIIPALWEAKVGRLLEVRSMRPAWPTWQNPHLYKNLARRGGTHL